MAKKQTRRSVSLSRATYERLKAFCEVNSVSMSEFVETRIGDFLGKPRKAPAAPTHPNAGAPVLVDDERPRQHGGGIFTF
jgi:hypothetical protein